MWARASTTSLLFADPFEATFRDHFAEFVPDHEYYQIWEVWPVVLSRCRYLCSIKTPLFNHVWVKFILETWSLSNTLYFCCLSIRSDVQVVSGGVACNKFIRRAMGLVCQHMGYSLAVPPPHLCTDNGIMIAWNGIERLCAGIGVTHDLDSVDIASKWVHTQAWMYRWIVQWMSH